MSTRTTLHESSSLHSLGYREVTPGDLFAHRGTARLIDVREANEYVDVLGHVAGAELVPLATVPAAAAEWNHDEELVLICRSGSRSGRACDALLQLGFKNLFNLKGGMLAWHHSGLPTERG
jgi:rhodanese-related sulfurtransferase